MEKHLQVNTPNLLVALHRWAPRQDENFTTEAFAHLLSHLLSQRPATGRRVLERLVGDIDHVSDDVLRGSRIQVQHVTRANGTPDIRIANNAVLSLVEVKVGAGQVGKKQLQAYLRELKVDSSGAERRCVVALTHYPPADDVPDEVRCVRWYEVAEELHGILTEVPREPERLLVSQFVGLLQEMGMTLPAVRSSVSDGLARYVAAHPKDSILNSVIKSPTRLDGIEDLRPLRDLLELMGKVLEQTGLFRASRLVSGQSLGGWIGYSLDNMQFFLWMKYSNPELVVFSNFDFAIDPEKFDGSRGRTEEMSGRWRWIDELNLAKGAPDFFGRSRVEQVDLLARFIADSRSFAETLAVEGGRSG